MKASGTLWNAIRAVLVVVAGAAWLGCSSHPVGAAADPIKECDELMGLYAACVGRLSPLGSTDPRIAEMRARFAPPSDESEREQQRRTCVSSADQLRTGCQ